MSIARILGNSRTRLVRMFTVALLNTAALFSSNLGTSWAQEPEGANSDLRLASTQRGTLTITWDAATDWRSSDDFTLAEGDPDGRYIRVRPVGSIPGEEDVIVTMADTRTPSRTSLPIAAENLILRLSALRNTSSSRHI